MTMLLLGLACGVVLKTPVPMPWLDDPVRNGWRWVVSKVSR